MAGGGTDLSLLLFYVRKMKIMLELWLGQDRERLQEICLYVASVFQEINLAELAIVLILRH